MNVVIASDHAGFEYKQMLIPVLVEAGYNPTDLGTHDHHAADYPDQARAVAEAILKNNTAKGIIICGSGAGVCMAANKFRGIRAATCHDTYSARQSVEHDHANVLCIGARVIGPALMIEVCHAFLKAIFSREERHLKRLAKIENIELQNFK